MMRRRNQSLGFGPQLGLTSGIFWCEAKRRCSNVLKMPNDLILRTSNEQMLPTNTFCQIDLLARYIGSETRLGERLGE